MDMEHRGNRNISIGKEGIMTRKATGFGPEERVDFAANVPGAPTFVENEQFRITPSNDWMVFTSDQGGPVDIDVAANGVYTGAALATALQSAMNADTTLTGTGTITFAVSWDDTAKKFTIDAGEGHTIALTYSGSDAATTFGFTTDAAADQSIMSDSETHGLGTITFDLDVNGNGEEVLYAIYSNTDSKYVDTNGYAPGPSEVWQTLEQWDNGGQNGRVTTQGNTENTEYTYKVKAKAQDGTETAFGPDSTAMNTLVFIDWGLQSEDQGKRLTTGNTRVKSSGVTDADGVAATIVITGESKAIAITFALENYDSTGSRITFEFSEDSGSTWATARSFFEIDSWNNVLRFTSDQGGPVDITVASATYDTGAALATALQSAMNANNTLTGTGTITFAVSFSTSTGKYTIDAGEGHTIALDYYNSVGAYTFGFTDSVTAAQTNTSDETRGDPPNTLSSSSSGTSHTIYWDSGHDAGRSERKTSSCQIRITPYDASPSGGDAAKVETSTAFTVNNRPSTVTITNADSKTYDKDTTPVFQAVMGEINHGSYLFYEITIEDATDTVLRTSSASNVAGWEYEQTPGNWEPVPVTGIPIIYADGTNKVRYTVQTALDADNDNDYTVVFRQGEVRHRGE